MTRGRQEQKPRPTIDAPPLTIFLDTLKRCSGKFWDGKQLKGIQSGKSRAPSITQLVCIDPSKPMSHIRTPHTEQGACSELKAKERKPDGTRRQETGTNDIFGGQLGKLKLGDIMD